MTVYITSIFPTWEIPIDSYFRLDIIPRSVEEVSAAMDREDFVSAIHDADIAAIASNLLKHPCRVGEPIFKSDFERDSIYWMRYRGPRVWKGAQYLPPGGQVFWSSITVVPGETQ